MKVLVVSDTHVPAMAPTLPEHVMQEASLCDMIIHAGDHVSTNVLDQLSSIRPLKAVYGNMDPTDVRERLSPKQIVELEGWRIGVVHGHEGHGERASERALNAFRSEDVDCVIFGHSHYALCEQREDSLLFNPGSPTAGKGKLGSTYGILQLGSTISVRIVKLPTSAVRSG